MGDGYTYGATAEKILDRIAGAFEVVVLLLTRRHMEGKGESLTSHSHYFLNIFQENLP